MLRSVGNKQNMYSSELFSTESGYEIDFCQKWLVQPCCQILMMKQCKNRAVGNTENFKNNTT